MLLEEKSTIPAVAAQLAYLASVQETAFWEGIALNGFEELRLRLRGLVPFLDKKTRTIVYTDFQDEITAVREGVADDLPRTDRGSVREEGSGVPEESSRPHRDTSPPDHTSPLTATDLARARADTGRYRRGRRPDTADGPPGTERRSFPWHISCGAMVGMDRAAAQEVFSEFLSNRSLTTPQIRFIENGDRPAHVARCHGAIGALRGAVQ